MPRKKLQPDAAMRARAKRLFDLGASVRDLAPMLGMNWTTLYKRIREWGWVRPIKTALPLRQAEDALLQEPGKIPDWLEDAAEAAELQALERNARRLAAVAKGFAALEKIDGPVGRPAPAIEDAPVDVEAMRAELRRRLEVLAAAYAEGQEGQKSM
jgi:hypothetical protein